MVQEKNLTPDEKLKREINQVMLTIHTQEVKILDLLIENKELNETNLRVFEENDNLKKTQALYVANETEFLEKIEELEKALQEKKFCNFDDRRYNRCVVLEKEKEKLVARNDELYKAVLAIRKITFDTIED